MMETPVLLDPQQEANVRLARARLLPFIKVTMPEFEIHPVHRLVADELERFEAEVEARHRPRLIINLPPRVGKSEMVSRKFPPWVLGRHPEWNIFMVSYGADLAEELSDDAKRCVQSDDYATIFGASSGIELMVEVDPQKKGVGFWRINGTRGAVRAVGVGGALTGRGAQIGIIDDPTKGRKEADQTGYLDDQWAFYKGTFYPRLEPGAGVIIMATRWATNDLPGRLIEEMELREGVDRWRVISLPMEAEPGGTDLLGRAPGEVLAGRFSAQEMAAIKANMPPREWLAQYQQRPVPAEGAIFHPYELFLFGDPPLQEDGEEFIGPRYAFADTSYARTRIGDFSVEGVWQLEPMGPDRDGVMRPTLGLLDVYRGRYQFPELKALMKHTYDKYHLWAQIIEDYGSGTSLAQEFRRDAGMNIITWRPDRDKVARAYAATDVMSTYRIRLPKTDLFPSGLPVRVVTDELANFQGTNDAHDDIVDMFSMAMILIGVRQASSKRYLRPFRYEIG